MRKIYTLALLAAGVLAGGSAAKAEAYTFDFNESFTVNENGHTLPAGWGHLPDGVEDDYSWDQIYPRYTYTATEGVDGSGALKVGTQTSVTYANPNTYDLIITPKVSGTIKLKAKMDLSNPSSSFVQFYKVTPDGNSWKRGERISDSNATNLVNMNANDLSRDEFREMSFTIDGTANIGIRCSNIIIDDFYADAKEVMSLMTVKATNATIGGLDPKCDKDNNFVLSFDVTVTNAGETVLTPETENAYVQIATSASSTASKLAFFEPVMHLTQSLNPGESAELSLSATIPYDGTRGDEYETETRFSAGVYNGFTEEYKSVGWFEPKPYKPELKFRDSNGSLVTEPQNFGRLHGTDAPVSKTYRLCNSGAAPMEVTQVLCPEGFALSGIPDVPFSVASDEYQELTITLNTDIPVSAKSDLVISVTGLDDYTLGFSGIVFDPAKWVADFEDQFLPSTKVFPPGVYVEDGWSLSEYSSCGSRCAAYYSTNDLSRHDYFVTPLLEFTEGENFAFDVSKINNSSEMDVYYSTDRMNWTLLKNIPNSEITSEKDGSDYYAPYKYSSYAVTLPAGQYYIGFDANYCYLDNLYGGNPVSVEHDLMAKATSTPTHGMVNYDYTATGTISNIIDKEDVVKVSMLVNDETVAETEVTVPSLSKGTEFSLSFLSNDVIEEGKARFVISAEDYSLETPEWDIDIQEEQMSAEAVTPYENFTTSSNAPWSSHWNITNTRIVYPESFVPFEAGTQITGIKFYGYNTSTHTSVKVSAWAAKTEAETAEKATPDLDVMTLVADAKDIAPVIVPQAKSGEEILYIPFDQPFTYEGGNLELFLTLQVAKYNSGFNARVIDDEGAANCQAFRHHDTDIESASYSSENLPVTGFTYAVEPAVLTGIVEGQFDKGEGIEPEICNVEGAVVTLTEYISPEEPENPESTGAIPAEAPVKNVVTYTTVTDADGMYTLTVMQPEKEYTLTVSHPDYYGYTHDSVVNFTEREQEINIRIINMLSGVKNAISDASCNKVYSISGTVIDSDVNNLQPGVYVINGKKVVVTNK